MEGISQGIPFLPENQHQLCARADRRALQQDPFRTLRRPVLTSMSIQTVRFAPAVDFQKKGGYEFYLIAGISGLQGRPSEFAGGLVFSGPASTPRRDNYNST